MKNRIISRFRRSRLLRIAASLAISGQVLIAVPVFAQDAARAAVKAGAHAAAAAKRKATKASVRVNRTVPTVTSPVHEIAFGVNVSTEMIRNARIFDEPLIPVGTPSADENRELGRLLQTVASLARERQASSIEQYLTDHPSSSWKASLLATAAGLFAKEGYYSRAASYWQQAFWLTRDLTEPEPRAIADYVLGESLTQMMMFGQTERMGALFAEVETRNIRGTAAAKVSAAREGLTFLSQHHEMATFSGPEALKKYLLVRPTASMAESLRTVATYHPAPTGTSLADLQELARDAGVALEMVHIAAIGEIPVPSIVHLRSQHYTAIVGKTGDRYIVKDPAMTGVQTLSAEAIRDESSGYMLLPAQVAAGLGARIVEQGEAASVIGNCLPGGPAANDPPCPDGQCEADPCGGDGQPGGGGTPGGDPENEPPCQGMPGYAFHPQKVSLLIDDLPVGYRPPVGPPINFQLSYDHRENRLPQTFTFGNAGAMWSHNWLSFVTEGAMWVHLRGIGQEQYISGVNHPFSGASLVKVADDPIRYERRLPNGSVEVFTFGDRPATQPNRKVFLTEVIDPQGHTVTLTYDSSVRLVAITDAIGQVTTLDYTDAADPLRITKITDPFGRFAMVTYNASGLLTTITDAIGMSSSFSYGGGDFIQSMTTPYGTTTFRHEPQFADRRIEATDPAGGTERLEYHWSVGTLPTTVDSSDVPTGFTGQNVDMHKYNTFYWDKVAFAAGPTLANATITSLVLSPTDISGHAWARNIPHSIKRPLESRIWFLYPSSLGRAAGITSQPTAVARVVDGGATQLTQFTYNSKRRLVSQIDPIGRQTNFTYATNGLDLLTIEQVRSGGTDVVQAFSGYNTQHLPGTVTDSAGQDTDFTYNSAGQPLTVTNAKNETTTLVYDTDGYLQTVTGAVSGATTTLTYDAYGRVDSAEGSDGYVVSSTFDNLNRLTSRTYPDATTETYTYNKLRLAEVSDRLGRITRHFYDGYGRPVATRDPAARTVSQIWCACGSLDALVDAKGQRTSWERDVQGRIAREIRADGTTDTHYTYDLSGRLKTVTDPMDQVTTYTYNLDDSLAGTGFTNETIATPDISHTYDAYYPRPLTMVDGNGTTTYSYKAAGTNGAGQLASVDGPFSNDTMVYTYDELGREATRMLNSTGTELTYDALGRLSQLEVPIGAFDYTYVGHTGRRASVTYPNNQTTTYSYLDDEHDFRLQTIHHMNPAAATLSKFDYTYDVVGNIQTWRQERAGSATKVYAFEHDLVDQLTSSVLTDTNITPTVLKRQAWAYDMAGNRSVDQNDDAVFATSYDNLNRLGSRAPGGPIVFAGSLNEAGSLTIDGKPAAVDAANNFRGTATLAGATTTVMVKAKDASGNETTEQYEVDASGGTTSYTYDANGNLTSDSKTYYWNALNQLVEVKQGTTTIATFEYDGRGRRTEKVAAGLTHQYIYDAEDVVEERISGSSSDTIRYYHGVGIDEPLARKNSSDAVTYYLADHLGSIVQETNASGAVTLEREYDPWGVASQGASTSGYGFTGREWDAETGLSFYRARYYSPQSGRWLNEDPIGLAGGSHLSAYVSNNPTRFIDPFGLCGDQPGETLKDRVVRNLLGLMDMLTLAEPVQAPGEGEADNPIPDRSPDTAVLIAATLLPAAKTTNLAKMLQSEAGVAELLAGGGKVIAGAGHKNPIRDIARLVGERGGTPADWVKISSTTPGLETHAYKNITTQVVVELKSIPPKY